MEALAPDKKASSLDQSDINFLKEQNTLAFLAYDLEPMKPLCCD